MGCISYDKLWESEFDNIVSRKDKVQNININQLKNEVRDIWKKDEKITTNFESTDHSNVVNKAFPDESLSKINGHLLLLEKDYNESKLHYIKQSVEILIQRAVKTIQKLFDKGLFDSFPNADKVLKDFLFVTRRRPGLKKVNDDVDQWLCS